MQFPKGYIYHIYNQGNNRQEIFFDRENYIFFLRKIKTHVLPYADILAWCLMPNHSHLMVYVREVELDRKTLGVSLRHAESKRTFNASIGIMLMAYTKAINKQRNRTGKLFREKTKAECVNCPNGITPSFITKNGITEIKIADPEKQYPQILFNYIHKNPVRANLTKKETDWEFSSAKDYADIRNGKLINKNLAEKYVKI